MPSDPNPRAAHPKDNVLSMPLHTNPDHAVQQEKHVVARQILANQNRVGGTHGTTHHAANCFDLIGSHILKKWHGSQIDIVDTVVCSHRRSDFLNRRQANYLLKVTETISDAPRLLAP